jgi:4-hydroxy-3-methylbut-2-enyl diphosphate reductase
MVNLLVCAPLAVEAMALRERAHMRVVRTGMGADRSRRAAAALALEPARAVVVAGFAGAVDPSLEPGDVVVATTVIGPDERSRCASESLTPLLRAEGLRVVVGTIACREHIVRGEERRELFDQGACVVDMESAWLAGAAAARPFSVVRAVVDTPRYEISRVLLTLRAGVRAYQALTRVGRALSRWAAEGEF